ncbi:MAG: hypothetical protein EON48_15490 [Acetobacteraceae bacterium]|nr:MAG: hypothetical protein EON48_15490 [Acetobacteraceae bacterium]
MTPSRSTLLILTAGLALSVPGVASAQVPDLGGMARGLLGGSSGAASQDPDIFLGEALDATKQMMVAAAVLAQMSRNKNDMAAISERVNAIQNVSEAGDLGAYNASFEEDIAALQTNASDASELQAIYDSANRRQKELMLSASLNFARAVILDGQLAQQFPAMLGSMARNPRHWNKVGHARPLGSMINAQWNAGRSMWDPVTALLRSQNVAVPSEASLGEARTISL